MPTPGVIAGRQIGKHQAAAVDATPAPLRILVISNLYPPHYLGGYELLCAQVVRALAARGHQVEVLTSIHGSGEAETGDAGVRVHRRLMPHWPFVTGGHGCVDRNAVTRGNRDITARVIAAARFDIVFLWSQHRITVGPSQAVDASDVPCAYSFNDDTFAGYAPKPWRLRPRALWRWLMDRTRFRDATLARLRLANPTCISLCVRDRLVDGGVPIADAAIIYQGIPIDRFPCRVEAQPVPGAALRLLYVGQLHDYKGVHTLLEAVGHLAADGSPARWRVTIAGDGPDAYRRRLRALVPSGVAVQFLGKVAYDALPAVYRAHDVFVFPSIVAEGFGLTFLEAMASGLPVVSTLSGGQAECLVDGVNALTFPAGDAAALAQRLRRLADDPVAAAALAAAGRRLVEQRFTLDRYIDDIEAFLRRAIAAASA